MRNLNIHKKLFLLKNRNRASKTKQDTKMLNIMNGNNDKTSKKDKNSEFDDFSVHKNEHISFDSESGE